jgi:hypothetical protein
LKGRRQENTQKEFRTHLRQSFPVFVRLTGPNENLGPGCFVSPRLACFDQPGEDFLDIGPAQGS